MRTPTGYETGLTLEALRKIRGKDLAPVPIPSGGRRPKEKQ